VKRSDHGTRIGVRPSGGVRCGDGELEREDIISTPRDLLNVWLRCRFLRAATIEHTTDKTLTVPLCYRTNLARGLHGILSHAERRGTRRRPQGWSTDARSIADIRSVMTTRVAKRSLKIPHFSCRLTQYVPSCSRVMA